MEKLIGMCSLNGGNIEVWIRTNTIADMSGADSVHIMNSGDAIPSGFNNKGYIQCQVNFSTPDTNSSPILNSIEIEITPIAIEEKSKTKYRKSGLDVYPNPFMQSTQLTVDNQESTAKDCKIQIYDVVGKLVKSLPINKLSNDLITRVKWDGRNNYGKRVNNGIYFVEIKTTNYKLIKELTKI